MRKSRRVLAASVAAIGFTLGSVQINAAEFDLTISSWTPPSAGMNAMMWPNLIEMIEQATDGRVSAEVKLNLASPPAQFDLIQDGAADLAWIFHGYNPGRFVTTKLIELPGYDGSAEAASVAYWRAYEKYFAAADEHRGVKVVGLMTHGPGQVHSNKPVTSLADIQGLKLRIGGGVAADAGAALNATGIRVPAPKVYETLASHAADGTMMPLEARKSFKLVEVATNMYEMPGGFYRGSFAIIMNQEKFDSLPADIQAALTGVFGEPTSRMAGKVWDDIDAAGRAATEAAGDNSITVASAEDQAAFGKIASDITAKVLDEVAAEGVDAAAAYEYIKGEMSGY